MTQSQRSQLCGIIIIDKPLRKSSMQAVAAVRHRTGDSKITRCKVGHAGTLDPLATGVLVMAVGKATKSIDRFMNTKKRYLTTIDLSAFTTTDDLEGEREEIEVANPPSLTSIEKALEQFLGSVMQRPPAFSAMKIDGRRAYKLARQGEDVDIPARPITIDSIDIRDYDWPLLTIDVHCGKGTYIRSLARDIGKALGTGGHCNLLRRTAVGPFNEAMSIAIDDLPERLSQDDLLPLDHALGMLG